MLIKSYINIIKKISYYLYLIFQKIRFFAYKISVSVVYGYAIYHIFGNTNEGRLPGDSGDLFDTAEELWDAQAVYPIQA